MAAHPLRQMHGVDGDPALTKLKWCLPPLDHSAADLLAVVCPAVTTPGYTYSAGGGSECPVNTYNPGANRIPACYKCPSGLITSAVGSTAKRNCSECPCANNSSDST